MKFFRLLFFGGLGFYGCGFCAWIVLANLLTSLTASQLPFGGPEALAWQLGTPMDSYDEVLTQTGTGLAVAGKVTWSGYAGPESFICGSPVAGGYVTSDFDDGRFTQDGEAILHGGIDYGTGGQYLPLSTPMGGEVVFAGWTDVGYGYLVVIENNGVRQYLGHLSEISASVGQVVIAGDVIGVSGDTGNSTGPHVHLEYRRRVGEEGSEKFDPRLNFVPGQTAPCAWDEQKE